jgi:hypothetical protein
MTLMTEEGKPMTLDPTAADLLAAVVDLDAKTRALSDADRSTVFAYLGGLLGTVVRGDASMLHAVEVLRGDGWQLLLPDPRRPARK